MGEILEWLLSIPILGELIKVIVIGACAGVLLLLLFSIFFSDGGPTYGSPH